MSDTRKSYTLSSIEENEKKIILSELVTDWRDPEFHYAIERDYSGVNKGHPMAIRFVTTLPPSLIGAVTSETYERTIRKVNEYFSEAEKVNLSTMAETCLNYLTCTFVSLCRKSKYQKALDKIGEFLYEENDRIYHPIGLHVVHPFARGLRRMVIRSIARYELYRYFEDTVSDQLLNNSS